MFERRQPSGAISADPSAPHYFLFRGKRQLLLTTAEHYGAVVNAAFDYVRYLGALAEHGLNYTRIYPGAYVEVPGFFVADNTLGPAADDYLVPWARSDVPGYSQGGSKFDLTRWDERYFARAIDFVAEAGARGIVVEVCLYNCMYGDIWPHSPLNAVNNVNGVGTMDHIAFQTLRDPPLVMHQDAYVREITRRLNPFDNVIIEIIDEPTLRGTPDAEAARWTNRMIDVVIDTEETLPNKHLIANQIMGSLGGPLDFSSDPRVGVATGQYIERDFGGQVGGMVLLDSAWGLEKPIELNETAYFPNWYEEGDKVAAVRTEAWEFIVGGGAAYNHLSAEYTVSNPAAAGTLTVEVMRMLATLRTFMERFDLARMRPWDPTSQATGGVVWRGMHDPGRHYVLYIHHSTLIKRQRYQPVFGSYRHEMIVNVPPGRYRLDWIDPKSLAVVASETLDHPDYVTTLTTPEHEMDLVMELKSTD